MGEPTGAELIAAERQRQIHEEGWTPEHDARHRGFELSRAARVYAIEAQRVARQGPCFTLTEWEAREYGWPEGWEFKGGGASPGDAIHHLVRAGALIAAEIDRLQGERRG